MTRHNVMGREGMWLAVLAAGAMYAAAYFLDSPVPLLGDLGTCLPSPNKWPIPPIVAWAIDTALMAIATFVLYFFNKEYQLVPGSDTVLPGFFLLMAASNPWISGLLTSSTIFALANITCMAVLFGCYRKRTAAQEMFLIATIISLGSMIQYAFFFLIPVYLIGAMMLRCLGFKGFVAFLMGMAAPYWVGVGMGVIDISWFHYPTFTNLFDGFDTNTDLFIGLITIASTVLVSTILALNNMVKQYAGNTQRRLYNSTMQLLGFVCSVCMVLDFNNIVAYTATVYLVAAFQLANLFALWNIRYGRRWLLLIAILYLISFILMTLI